MKKVVAVLICVALLATSGIVFAACTKQQPKNEEPSQLTGGDIVGGWTKADSPVISDSFKKVFEKATDALTGVEYVPVAYLASQVVAGTNHCVLCKATPVVPGAATTYSIVYIYEDLSGNVEITEIAECDIDAEYQQADGTWTEANTAVTDKAKQVLAKACETLTGAEYTPVVLLATQVVAGTNYRIICEAKATIPNAESEYVIVDVYADLEGNAEITETYEFAKEESTQMANPLVEYGSDEESLESAEEAVKFNIEFPDSVKAESYIVISGKILEINFDGGYLRKSKGNEDISGDYNEYGKTETKTVDGREVTLKGNDGKVMLAIWTDSDYTYCVGITDGASEADMFSLVKGIK